MKNKNSMIVGGLFCLIVVLGIIALIMLWNSALECDRGYNLCMKNNSEQFCGECKQPLTKLVNVYNKYRLEAEYTRCDKELHECLDHYDACSNCGVCFFCRKRVNKTGDYTYY